MKIDLGMLAGSDLLAKINVEREHTVVCEEPRMQTYGEPEISDLIFRQDAVDPPFANNLRLAGPNVLDEQLENMLLRLIDKYTWVGSGATGPTGPTGPIGVTGPTSGVGPIAIVGLGATAAVGFGDSYSYNSKNIGFYGGPVELLWQIPCALLGARWLAAEKRMLLEPYSLSPESIIPYAQHIHKGRWAAAETYLLRHITDQRMRQAAGAYRDCIMAQDWPELTTELIILAL